jgi:lysophospholipase L1-like esterase
MKKHKLAVLAGLVTTLVLTGAAAFPAQAVKPQPPSPLTYSALGDSFAAGFGAGEVNGLGQSAEAYPVVLAGGANVNFLASSWTSTGSDVTAATVAAYQIPLIPHTTKQVTLTVGGNDLGFVLKVTACFTNPAACAFSDADRAKLGTLTKSLSANITAIHVKAPAATIYVTGYPLLFQAADSGRCVVGGTPPSLFDISKAQADAMDADAVALNSAIMSAITGPAPRANYVDVTVAFTGHGLCGTYDSQAPNPHSYINQFPAVNGIAVPLHPTADGQQAYAASIRAKGFKG